MGYHKFFAERKKTIVSKRVIKQDDVSERYKNTPFYRNRMDRQIQISPLFIGEYNEKC